MTMVGSIMRPGVLVAAGSLAIFSFLISLPRLRRAELIVVLGPSVWDGPDHGVPIHSIPW